MHTVAVAARVRALLSHRTRLHIVVFLAQGDATVRDLVDALGVRQSNASHHLSILRGARLVTARRAGQQVVYRSNVASWCALGDGFFDHLVRVRTEVSLAHFPIGRRRDA